VELRQLRCFVAVAEELHFGRAADRLHVAQPAVSQQVGRLERQVGLRLFDRSSRRVRLTAAGERLLTEARATLAAADRVLAVAADLAAAPTGVLRVGVSHGLASRLESVLAGPRAADPAHRFDVEVAQVPVAEQPAALSRGELDLMVTRPVPTRDGLRIVTTWPEPVVAVLPAGHPLAGRPAVRLRDLADLPVRLPASGCDPAFRAFALAACHGDGFEPRLGRPSGDPAGTMVEIGVGDGPPVWTLTYDEPQVRAFASSVSVLPLDPPLVALGAVVISSSRPAACTLGLRDAGLVDGGMRSADA
jgi:DNA-binding transcriptional LysR family regulator